MNELEQFRIGLYTIICSIFFISCKPNWSEKEIDGLRYVTNAGGSMLAYSPESGIGLVFENGLAFKDLNKNQQLDPYEDWRLSATLRATDLASKMSIEQIAGLMLYSGHQRIPGGGFGPGSTYNGKSFEESGTKASDLTDDQIEFLTNDNLRHVLVTSVESPEVAAIWSNNAQKLVEGLGLGIPVNNSSDPRHQASNDDEFVLGGGGQISSWPGQIGLAATFDPQLVKRFGEIASIEYRALGISTALSPQVDLATDPRWYRFSGTFGPSPELSIDMARAYVDGFQTSSMDHLIADGWGYESVNAMFKHWPGGGTGEGGRDAHYGFGKFAVFPGDNLSSHIRPFIEGVFDLKGGTARTSAIMPYYTISTGQNPNGENVGNAFSRYFITDQLREQFGFDGVVCTDWGVTRADEGMDAFGRTPWGVEDMTVAERHYRVLMAGCDQFGGNNDSEPVLEAYQMGVSEYGEEFMRQRFETSAVRLLMNIFRVGLFENPYLDVEKTKKTVGHPDFMQEGFNAQKKSVVLLKNLNKILPLTAQHKVFIPKRYVPATHNFFGAEIPARWEDPINHDLAKKYFQTVADPEEADVAIVVVNSPENGRTAGYHPEDTLVGGNGFFPISLQYGSYTASEARDPSLAGDKRAHDILNRTYRGKTVTAENFTDLKLIMDTRKAMGSKPIVVILRLQNPTVVAEFEKEIDALLINFRVQDQAILEIISGKDEPSGLLPLQMPANMSTVEQQMEDVPFDMVPHLDESGNRYDFGFGLNWNGIIQDQRTEKYSRLKEM